MLSNIAILLLTAVDAASRPELFLDSGWSASYWDGFTSPWSGECSNEGDCLALSGLEPVCRIPEQSHTMQKYCMPSRTFFAGSGVCQCPQGIDCKVADMGPSKSSWSECEMTCLKDPSCDGFQGSKNLHGDYECTLLRTESGLPLHERDPPMSFRGNALDGIFCYAKAWTEALCSNVEACKDLAGPFCCPTKENVALDCCKIEHYREQVKGYAYAQKILLLVLLVISVLLIALACHFYKQRDRTLGPSRRFGLDDTPPLSFTMMTAPIDNYNEMKRFFTPRDTGKKPFVIALGNSGSGSNNAEQIRDKFLELMWPEGWQTQFLAKQTERLDRVKNLNLDEQRGEIECKKLVEDERKFLLYEARGGDSRLGHFYLLQAEGIAKIMKFVMKVAYAISEKRDVLLIACGGDGSVGWVLTESDEERKHRNKREDNLPVGIIPLGTGNDFSRSLGWGPAFTELGELGNYLRAVSKSEKVYVDKWKVKVKPESVLPKSLKDNNAEAEGYFYLYFSLGTDGEVTLGVDGARKSCLGKCCFKTRGPCCLKTLHGGLCCYLFHGAPVRCFCCKRRPLLKKGAQRDGAQIGSAPEEGCCHQLDRCFAREAIEHVKVKQQQGSDTVENIRFDRDIRQLTVCNLNSYGAGMNLTSRGNIKSSPSDGYFEVFGISSPLALARLTGSSKACGKERAEKCLGPSLDIKQCCWMEIKVKEAEYYQMDGEPWHLQSGSKVTIEHAGRVRVLAAPGSLGKVLPPQPGQFWAR